MKLMILSFEITQPNIHIRKLWNKGDFFIVKEVYENFDLETNFNLFSH